MQGMRRMRVRSSERDIMRSIQIAVALVCVGLLSLQGDALGAENPATRRVIIEGTAYEPAALTIKRGDTVEWINKDPFPHTVTAAPILIPAILPRGNHGAIRRAPRANIRTSVCCIRT